MTTDLNEQQGPLSRKWVFPRLGRPRVRTWNEVRQLKSSKHLRHDLKKRNIDQDQGRVAKAAEFARKAAAASGTFLKFDLRSLNLDQAALQTQRKLLLKLIWKAVEDVEEQAKGPIFWFALTIVSPGNFVCADDITPHRMDRIKRWHRSRFSKVAGGIFEAGFIDISRNDEIEGKGVFSVHEHTLIGVQAATENAARAALRSAYSLPYTADLKPLFIKRTFVRGSVKRRSHAIGWMIYCNRSCKAGLIMRREPYVDRDGKSRVADRHLKPYQLAELLPQLARLSFSDRVIISGARISFGRLQPRCLQPPAQSRSQAAQIRTSGRIVGSSLPREHGMN